MIPSNPKHTYRRRIDGSYQTVPKTAYSSEADALAAIETVVAIPTSRPAPFGYGAYRCPHCPAWHFGRNPRPRPERTPEHQALVRLYWSIWRYAYGKTRRRSPRPLADH